MKQHEIGRDVRINPQASLFGDDDPTVVVAEYWWGMPELVMGDARPCQRITVNFMSPEDVRAFAARLGLSAVTRRTDSVWFPPRSVETPSDWVYSDES